MSHQTMSLDRYEPDLRRVNASPRDTSSHSHAKYRRHSSLRRRAKDARHSPALSMAGASRSMIQTEQIQEASIRILVWDPTASNASASTSSALARTPILRDVPQVKRKLGRRDNAFSGNASQINLTASSSNTSEYATHSSTTSSPSSHTALGSPNSSLSTFSGLIPLGPSDYRSVIKNAAPSWLREKPSKSRLNGTAATALPQSLPGAWRRATMVCRETGVLLLFGEDNALLHSIATTSLDASDVRIVDNSLFCRPNVLGIFSKPSSFSAGVPLLSTPSKTASGAATRGNGPAAKDEPLFLCFGASQKMLRWRVLLRSFARPEVYGPVSATHRSGTHRIYRQIDMTVLEAKVFAERPNYAFDKSRRRSSGHMDGDSTDSPSASNPTAGQANGASVHHRRSSDASPLRALSSFDDNHRAHHADRSSTVNELSPHAPSYARPTAEQERRPSHDYFGMSAQVQSASCFCQVWRAGEVVARTRLSHGTPTIAWFEKFYLRDLPYLGEFHIEVLQAFRNGKGYSTLGLVDLPVETMRRGDTVEGWFPIWSLARGGDGSSRYMESTARYSREVVGEIKLSLNVREEHVLALKRYVDVEAALRGPSSVDLMLRLTRELDEDRIVSHLVDIFAASGTVAERFTDLTVAESARFASEPALLFRGNTLLSRAIDKYQRRYCTDWLDACIGHIVRRICAEQVHIEAGEQNVFGVSRSSPGASSVTSDDTHDGSAELLKRLCNELWVNIYANRHRCPIDLCKALHVIRTEVNARFESAPSPGVQSVGAFVFLRLICPAITTPNLFGLMGHAPDPQSARTLMLIAKVFLALANKRVAFSRDKEPWLTRLDEFLERHATAYDDFITTISTPPESSSRSEPLGDEPDAAFQCAVARRTEQLPSLCREALPSGAVIYDHALALASLVTFIVRNAPINEFSDSILAVDTAKHGENRSRVITDEEYKDFIDACCDVEDMVGYHIDRAGLDPQPIDIAILSPRAKNVKTTSIYAANKEPVQAEALTLVTQGMPQAHVQTLTSIDGVVLDAIHPRSPSSPMSPRSRRATVSTQHDENGRAYPQDIEGATARTVTPPARVHAMPTFPRRPSDQATATENGRADRATQSAGHSTPRSKSQRPLTSSGTSSFTKASPSEHVSGRLSYDEYESSSSRRPIVDDRASFIRSPRKASIVEPLPDLYPAPDFGSPEPKQKRGWWRRKA